ncbi:response regulator [bacterium]|nr:response regulator [bacterium]MBU1983412.1 response regulator [bacterium]
MDKKLILIVDDEAPVRNVLLQAFQFAGYEVIEAADGEAGFDLFQKKLPALVITDIYMPKMNGILLLRQIRRHGYKAKVIMITGFAHYHQLTLDASSSPDGYFEKPFTLAELLSKANEVLTAA